MSRTIHAGFLGTGSYLPERIMTNKDMEKIVETSDEWIVTRTGIRERRMAAPDQTTSDMATEAAKKALASAGLKPTDLDLIILATITPDMPTPATACLVQTKLGAPQAAAFDISAACSGFVYGLTISKAFIESGIYKRILLIGAEKLTAFMDWKDRASCVLFGDGAGAAVIGEVPEGKHEILSSFMAANGGEADLLKIPGGGCKIPSSPQSVEKGMHFLKMEGKEIFKIAVKVMSEAVLEATRRANLDITQVSRIIPHQANMRIIQAIGERMNLPPEKLFVNLDRVGNTSAASVIIALDEAVQKGLVKDGDNIILVAFGAGTTLASSAVKW
ncbi:MAG TPA: beta-ketoacyl-ACP synthase III [bacterium]|nr:beta-ketoacyl-ACP synthase III [bacterium]